MTETSASLLPALAAVAPTAQLSRKLWLAGGRYVHPLLPTPATVKETKAMAAAAAATVAQTSDDPAFLASLWQLDSRVAVASAILGNKHVPAGPALSGIQWLLDRRENIPLRLVTQTCDIDTALDIITAHVDTAIRTANPENYTSVVENSLRDWTRTFGVKNIVKHAPASWAAEIVAWAIVEGPEQDAFPEELVDEIWNASSESAKWFTFKRVLQGGNLHSGWLRRFGGRPEYLCSCAGRVPFDAVTIGDPKLVAEMMEGATPRQLPTVLKGVASLYSRCQAANVGGNLEIPEVVADKLLGMLATNMKDPAAAVYGNLYELMRLTPTATTAAVEDICTLLQHQKHTRHNVREATRKIVQETLTRLDVGQHAAGLIASATPSHLTGLWLSGGFELNPPNPDYVKALLVLDTTTAEQVAAYPHLWGTDVETATRVVQHEPALVTLLNSGVCPQEVYDVLIAHLGDIETGGFDHLLDDPVTARRANIATAVVERQKTHMPTKIGVSVAEALLNKCALPEHLIVDTAAQAHKLVALCRGAYPLNPVPDDLLSNSQYADVVRKQPDALKELVVNKSASPALRAEAALAKTAPVAAVLNLATRSPLPFHLLERLACTFPEVAGKWLAGSLEANNAFSVHEILDALGGIENQHSIVEIYANTCFANGKTTHHPDVIEWVASCEGLLRKVNSAAAMRLVGTVLADRLPDDAAAWSMFAELGEGSDHTIDEIALFVNAAL